MCGIAGIVGEPVRKETLSAMADSLRHRGPDDDGYFLADGIGLAFRRLSIVDLSGGHQPIADEAGTIQVVFNGEIYNHRELRAELAARGHRFRTDHADSEVLVHGWKEWGHDLLPRLNGMFAFALWDARDGTIVLARDRFGIKPLYVADLPGGALAFASEARAIFASGRVKKAPSARGLLQYLSFQNVWGADTMFAGVRMLEPGTTLSWRAGTATTRRYWEMRFPRSRRDALPELAAAHREILERVLKRQIAADVPVMSYLSGGIDSTAITVGATRLDQRVTAYSVVFDLAGVGNDRAVDEREFSRHVAADYHLQRVEMELPQDVLASCMDTYAGALEEPRMGMGYPVYLVAKRVAQDAKVVLSGTGGDEIHAGYVGRYRALGLTGLPPERPAGLRGALRAMLAGTPDTAALYEGILNFVIPGAKQAEVFTPEFLREAGPFDPHEAVARELASCPSEDWRDRVMYVDARTYLHGLLVLEDKLSMASSLETRVPLLDNELVDFLLDVPFDALCKGDTGKILFRESVKPWVPPEIHAKPKMGFGPPDASWYRGALRPWLSERLAPEAVRRRGILKPEFVRATLDDHLSGRRDNTYLLWSFLNVEAWCKIHGFFGGS